MRITFENFKTILYKCSFIPATILKQMFKLFLNVITITEHYVKVHLHAVFEDTFLQC